MARRLAAEAKTSFDRDDAGAKMMLPESIDHDPCRERMGGARKPRGQLAPATPRADRRRLAGDEDARKSARHDMAAVGGIPPDQHRRILKAGVPRLGHAAILNDHRAGNLHRGLLRQGIVFSAEAFDPFPGGALEPGIALGSRAGEWAHRSGEKLEAVGASRLDDRSFVEPASADLCLDPATRCVIERAGDDSQLGQVAAKRRPGSRASPADPQATDVGGGRHRLESGV